MHAFNRGIQCSSSPGPDSLPDLFSSEGSSGISSINPQPSSGGPSVHRYPSMDKTDDIFTDAHLTRIRRRRRSSAPARVSFFSPPPQISQPSHVPKRHRSPPPEVSMLEPRSTLSTDRGFLNPPSDGPSLPSELQRAVEALQACVDEPARSTLPQETLLSVSRWLIQEDWPSDLCDVSPTTFEGASSNPIIISHSSSSGATQCFQADSEFEFRYRARC